MKYIIQGSMTKATQSAKLAAATSNSTVGVGLATWLEWIPTDIGKLATLIGIILSLVLIYTHIKKSKRDTEKHELEMQILRKKANEDKG